MDLPFQMDLPLSPGDRETPESIQRRYSENFYVSNPARGSVKISDHLYIGKIDTPYDDFDVIINLSLYDRECTKKYYGYDKLEDLERDDIKSATEFFNPIIDEAIQNGKNVLVHCVEGKSRSFVIIASYLISKGKKLIEILDEWPESWAIHPNLMYINFLCKISP